MSALKLQSGASAQTLRMWVDQISAPRSLLDADALPNPAAPKHDKGSSLIYQAATCVLADGANCNRGFAPELPTILDNFFLAAQLAEKTLEPGTQDVKALAGAFPPGFLDNFFADLPHDTSMLLTSRHFTSNFRRAVVAYNASLLAAGGAAAAGPGHQALDLATPPCLAFLTLCAAADHKFGIYCRNASANALAILGNHLDAHYARALVVSVPDIPDTHDRILRMAAMICQECNFASNINSGTALQLGLELALKVFDSTSFDMILRHLNDHWSVLSAEMQYTILVSSVNSLHYNYGDSTLTDPFVHAVKAQQLDAAHLLSALRRDEAESRAYVHRPFVKAVPLKLAPKLPPNDLRRHLDTKAAGRAAGGAPQGARPQLLAPPARPGPARRPFEYLPPNPDTYIMASVTCKDGKPYDMPLCPTCFKISRYNPRDHSWHTSLNCKAVEPSTAAAEEAKRKANPPDPPAAPRPPPDGRIMGARRASRASRTASAGVV